MQDPQLCIPQTCFPQDPRCKVTYRPPSVEHGPPWTADRYRQIDFIICRQEHRGAIRNSCSRTEEPLNWDHYLTTADIWFHPQHIEQREQGERFDVTNPTEEVLQKFNQKIREKLEGAQDGGREEVHGGEETEDPHGGGG